MARHFKVETDASPEDLESLKIWVREKNLTRTVDEVHEWLLAKGYTLSRNATFNWLTCFKLEEKTSSAAEFSKAILAGKAAGDPTAVVAATGQKLQEKFFEWAISEDAPTAKELKDAASGLRTMTGQIKDVIEIKRNFEVKGKEMVAQGKLSQALLSELAASTFGS